MKKTYLPLIALAFAPLLTFAQVTPAERSAANAAMTQALNERFDIERDIPYAQTDNSRQRLDVYRPKQRTATALPVIVFLHGGGWLQGDKADCARMISQVLSSGRFAAVAVGYRLTNEATWPAQIHDSKAGVRWVRANAEKYGFDASRIGVWGASAGGHLALLLGVTGDVPSLEGSVGPYAKVSSRVNAVANFLGITDLRTLNGQTGPAGSRAEELLLGGPVRENMEKAAAASPITYVNAKSAPILTVHGTADTTVPFDQAVKFDAALRKAGGTSYLVVVEGGGHGDFGFAANGRLDAFFEKYLLSQAIEIDTAAITNWRR